MNDFEWNPETYLAQMLAEIPGYEELQTAVAAATAGSASSIRGRLGPLVIRCVLSPLPRRVVMTSGPLCRVCQCLSGQMGWVEMIETYIFVTLFRFAWVIGTRDKHASFADAQEYADYRPANA